MINRRDKGAQLIVIAAICLLLSAALPMWFKTLFVAESGNFSTSTTGVILLIIGTLRRWRLAWAILLVLTFLYLWVDFFAFTHSPNRVGFLLIAPLHLIAFALLGFSRDVRQYIEKPLNAA